MIIEATINTIEMFGLHRENLGFRQSPSLELQGLVLSYLDHFCEAFFIFSFSAPPLNCALEGKYGNKILIRGTNRRSNKMAAQ